MAASGTSGFAWGRWLFWFGLTLVAFALFWAAFAFGYARMHETTVMPGVAVAGIDLSGLTRAAAEDKLREELPDLSTGELAVTVGTQSETIPYADFDRDYELDYMLDQAFGLGRRGSVVDQVRDQVGLLQSGANVEPVMTMNSQALATRVAALAELAKVEVVDAEITHFNGTYAVTPASEGTAIDVPAVVDQALSAVNNLSPADAAVSVDGTTVVPAVSTEAAQAAADQAEGSSARHSPWPAQICRRQSTRRCCAVGSTWIRLESASGTWPSSRRRSSNTSPTTRLETDVPATNATFKVGGGGYRRRAQ